MTSPRPYLRHGETAEAPHPPPSLRCLIGLHSWRPLTQAEASLAVRRLLSLSIPPKRCRRCGVLHT